ncbi:hypothetical protein VTK56DRAFT_6122 [Thermocarpiscus australiensis]
MPPPEPRAYPISRLDLSEAAVNHTISNSNTPATSAPFSSSQAQAESDSQAQTSPAPIVLGTLLGLGVLALLLWCACRHGRRRALQRSRTTTRARVTRTEGGLVQIEFVRPTTGDERSSLPTQDGHASAGSRVLQGTPGRTRGMPAGGSNAARQPPLKDRQYDAMRYLDREAVEGEGASSRNGDRADWIAVHRVGNGANEVERPLARRAVTSLPGFGVETATRGERETLGIAKSGGERPVESRPSKCESASSSASSRIRGSAGKR